MTTLPSTIVRSIRALVPPTADTDYVRAVMGRFPSGVAALCAIVDGRAVGMVATSFSAGVSYDPPMVMFSVQNSSSTWPVLRSAERIGVSVLGAEQAEACMQLASRSRDRFDGLSTAEASGGAILLEDAVVWFECEVVSTTPAGDHQVVVLQVHGMSVDHARAPLVYHERGFHSIRAIG